MQLGLCFQQSKTILTRIKRHLADENPLRSEEQSQLHDHPNSVVEFDGHIARMLEDAIL